MFATKKKEVDDDHLDKTHKMFHAMHEFMSVHRELPKVINQFVLHSIGPTGRERMSIGRLGSGEVLYRPKKGHLAEDKDHDGVIDDAGVNKDVLRLSIALDLVRKMEVRTFPPAHRRLAYVLNCSWADGMFCVAGHGKSGFRGLGAKVKPPHERCEGALSQSTLGATALTYPCAFKPGSNLA